MGLGFEVWSLGLGDQGELCFRFQDPERTKPKPSKSLKLSLNPVNPVNPLNPTR